jgi:methylase of polypeptide subunit release factors
MKKNAAELFTDGWTAYEKVLKHNYLFHEEIYSDIKKYLHSQQLINPLNILEAGCGDASQTIKIFKEFDVNSYLGIDLSSYALDIAKKILNVVTF